MADATILYYICHYSHLLQHMNLYRNIRLCQSLAIRITVSFDSISIYSLFLVNIAFQIFLDNLINSYCSTLCH